MKCTQALPIGGLRFAFWEIIMSAVPAASSPLAEMLSPLTPYQAGVEADRCLYCYDAPCVQACPTHIDIPGFIRKIAQERPRDAAKTILKSNLLGSTCARVCPVEELCEGACVMGHGFKPIAIGRLQRYATDTVLHDETPVFPSAPATGKRVAVVGAGPAGLSCAGELAKLGHAVEVFEKKPLPGGLSTYGIVTLREPVDVSLAEVELIKRLGVTIHTGRELGSNLLWEDLDGYNAVFLAVGLGSVPPLGIPGEEAVIDGLVLVEECKLAPETLKVGKHVAVIGAGNTAIDCATVAKRLGAEVTIVYRRTAAEMTAYEHEYEFAKSEGIRFQFVSQPVEVLLADGKVTGLKTRFTAGENVGAESVLECDQVVSAIGQLKSGLSFGGLDRDKGYIAVDEGHHTSRAKVFAGGDAVRSTGAASTVMAVQDGKRAAVSIHAFLTGETGSLEVRRG
jgi:glutamate synthase (NADPH/NADH) small chain